MTQTTPRGRMSRARRNHIFSENFGFCCLCGESIDRRNEKWRIEHIRALGLCGKDTNPNCGPAHEACALAKDKVDMAMIAKAKRVQEKHEGKKPAGRMKAPKGYVYDWKHRRYRRDGEAIWGERQ